MEVTFTSEFDEIFFFVGVVPLSFPDNIGDLLVEHAVLVLILNLINFVILVFDFLPIEGVPSYSAFFVFVVGNILGRRVDFASSQPLLLLGFGLLVNSLIVSTISI